MKLTGNTILITGGATGIGLALLEEFLPRGNRVIICGRRESRLKEVQAKHPEVVIKVCDVTDKLQRHELFNWVTTNYPELNVLVNNAGIQHYLDFTKGAEDFEENDSEIEVNLTAPIHLCGLFIPFLSQKPDAAILNISSGLAVIPISRCPVYCATKAALHVFSRCLRQQLAGSSIEVYEALPPAVESELNQKGRAGRPSSNYMSADIYAASVIAGLEAGKLEINNEYIEKIQDMTLRGTYEYFMDSSKPR